MLKQTAAILLLILASMAIILFMPYAQQGLQWLITGHTWVSNTLMDVFSGGQAGNLIRQTIALLAIPVLVTLIPAIIYWLMKRGWFPYLTECLWVGWLVQTAALVILFKAS